MAAGEQQAYPFNDPDYIPGFDDGQFCQRELGTDCQGSGWRSEPYAPQSNVLIADITRGHSVCKRYDDAGIQALLEASDAQQPDIRYILLEVQPNERFNKTRTNTILPAVPKLVTDGSVNNGDVPSQLNISYPSLIAILNRYHIPAAAASHVRGQEQVFGSKVRYLDDGNVSSFDFWYAIRARAIMRHVVTQDDHKESDLKMTVVTHYNALSRKSAVILKYRAFNDLPQPLIEELIQKLKEVSSHKKTYAMAGDPFALGLFHFSPTLQHYRRGAREPRDTIRKQEEKAHDNKGGSFASIDLRILHLTQASLDQNTIQLDFCIDLVQQLKRAHKRFCNLMVLQRSKRWQSNKHTPAHGTVKKEADTEIVYINSKDVTCDDPTDYTDDVTHDSCSDSDDPIENVNHDTTDSTIHQQTRLFARVDDELDRYASQFTYFRDSTRDVSARTQRLMGLLFNLSSSRMAQLAMHESASMSSIAFLTMLFLPGTLVAGVFGTNVVVGPERPTGGTGGAGGAPVGSQTGAQVQEATLFWSSQWYLLPVATVALTMLTFAGWYLWRARTARVISRSFGISLNTV